MHSAGRDKKISAFAILEYAIVLGVIFAALIGMNTYIKRGLQGRVKSMADNFISNEQEVDITTGGVSSESSTLAQSDIRQEGLEKGAMQLALLDARNTVAHSRVEDEKPPITTAAFTPADKGNVATPVRGKDTVDAGARTTANIDILNAEKSALEQEAAVLRKNADSVEQGGLDIRRDAANMHCRSGKKGRPCQNGRALLDQGGVNMITKAGEIRVQAQEIEKQAEAKQEEIDKLKNKPVDDKPGDGSGSDTGDGSAPLPGDDGEDRPRGGGVNTP